MRTIFSGRREEGEFSFGVRRWVDLLLENSGAPVTSRVVFEKFVCRVVGRKKIFYLLPVPAIKIKPRPAKPDRRGRAPVSISEFGFKAYWREGRDVVFTLTKE